MKFSWKKKAIGVAALAMMFGLSACGNGGGGDKANGKTELKFWTLSLQPTFTDYIQGIIDDYEEENPDIKIVWEDLPQDSIQDKLLTTTAGGNAPDVVNTWTDLTMSLAGKGALVDLNKEATDEQKAVYNEELFNSTKYKDGVYAFPWYTTPQVQMFNKSLYEKAGVSVPKTYEDIFDSAATVKEKTGAYQYIPNAFTQILIMDGQKVLNDDNTKAAFNNPDVVELLGKFKKAVDSGAMPKNGWESWEEMVKLYSVNQLASVSTGTASLARIKDEAEDVYNNSDVAPAIVGEADLVKTATQNLVVPATGKHIKEAVDFAAYVTNAKNQLEFSKLAEILPSAKEAQESDYFTSDTESLQGRARALAAEASTHATDAILPIPNFLEVRAEIDNIPSAVMNGTSVDKALADAEKKVNSLLERNN